MRFTHTFFATLAVAAGIAVAADASPSAAKDAFDKAAIPADLDLKDFKPKAVLEVAFPQDGPPQPGSQLPPPPTPLEHGGAQLPENNTLKPPTFCLRVPGKPMDVGKGPFVIAIVDPDAPVPENADNATETVRHFLGGGFTFKDDGVCLANNTPAVTEYEPPSPPKGSKPHRAVFLLYEQPDGFKEQTEVTPDTGRDAFNVSHFAEKVGLGEPVAGTYMLVGPQD